MNSREQMDKNCVLFMEWTRDAAGDDCILFIEITKETAFYTSRGQTSIWFSWAFNDDVKNLEWFKKFKAETAKDPRYIAYKNTGTLDAGIKDKASKLGLEASKKFFSGWEEFMKERDTQNNFHEVQQ